MVVLSRNTVRILGYLRKYYWVYDDMLFLIACSHRRHGQDKTVLSCLVRVGGANKLLLVVLDGTTGLLFAVDEDRSQPAAAN